MITPDFEELAKLGSKSSTQIMKPTSIPKETLKIGWSLSGIELYWHLPSEKHNITFAEESGIKSGLYLCPGLVFHYKEDTISVAAVKDKVINDETELYYAPFSNMIGKFNSCMGTAQPNSEMIENIGDLIRRWTLGFIEGEFTHNTSGTTKTKDLKEYYENHTKSLEKIHKVLEEANVQFGDW